MTSNITKKRIHYAKSNHIHINELKSIRGCKSSILITTSNICGNPYHSSFDVDYIEEHIERVKKSTPSAIERVLF